MLPSVDTLIDDVRTQARQAYERSGLAAATCLTLLVLPRTLRELGVMQGDGSGEWPYVVGLGVLAFTSVAMALKAVRYALKPHAHPTLRRFEMAGDPLVLAPELAWHLQMGRAVQCGDVVVTDRLLVELKPRGNVVALDDIETLSGELLTRWTNFVPTHSLQTLTLRTKSGRFRRKPLSLTPRLELLHALQHRLPHVEVDMRERRSASAG